MLAAEQMALEENEMLRNGVQYEEVIKYTHLSKDKLEKLKSQISKN